MEKNRRRLVVSDIAAGVAFAIITLLNIESFGYIFDIVGDIFNDDFIWGGLQQLLRVFSIPAAAILAIGCFTSLKPLKIVGAALGVGGAVSSLIYYLFCTCTVDGESLLAAFPEFWYIWVDVCLGLFFWFLLLFVCIRPKVKIAAFIAAGTKATLFVFALVCSSLGFTYSLGFTRILEYLLFIAVAVFFALDINIRSTVKSVQSSVNMSGTADRILKLKDLLDNGIITAEEFEAKKKQILSL